MDEKTDSPSPIGRPSEYKPEYAEIVEHLVLANQPVTDAELAEIFDVTTATIRNWRVAHREFFLASKKAKALKIARLTGRFMDRAMGMTIKEQRMNKEGDVVTLESELPPDTAAAIFALKNLAGWRDRTETMNVDVKLDLLEYAKEYAKRIGPEAAKRFLLDHGYQREVIEGQFETVPAREDSEP